MKELWKDKVDQIVDDYAQGRINYDEACERLKKMGCLDEQVDEIMDTL